MDHEIAGRFQLVDRIGAGGMGSVWRAWDRRQERYVAAKILGQHDGQLLLRFVREQALRIHHPHVVSPYGWAADDDQVVLAMDLVRGGSVKTLLGDHGSLPDTYVAVLLDQLLRALEAIHATGVVHRDIKPDNLLLEPTGTARPHLRVADFGIAAVADEVRLTQTAMSIGTLGYMAPEQAAGAEPDPRQDLYAAGVVGKQMITGLRPRDLPDTHPSPLWPLLERLSRHDPTARPQSAAEAVNVLARMGPPPGTPWQALPDPPEVFDQLGAPPDASPHESPTPEPAAVAEPVPSPPPTRRADRRRLILVGTGLCFLLAAVLLVVAIVALIR